MRRYPASAARLGRFLGCLAVCGLASPAVAQLAPRLTGEAVIAQLDTAGRELAARAPPGSPLIATSAQLARMGEALRGALGADASKPIEIIGDKAGSSAWRAHAAAQRTQAYLSASAGCIGSDTAAMASALATTVDRLAGASASAKAMPVIDAVQTLDHQPLFAIRPTDKPLAFALVGANLSDAQCADPQVTATDDSGALLEVQPVVTGVSPARIEMKLPASRMLKPGGYVLHVVPKRKVFLMGCTAQPEAVAVVQVAEPMRFSVDYALSVTCSVRDAKGGVGEKKLSLGAGTMPDITAYGSTVSQQIDTTACGDPLSYAVTAKVRLDDGSSASVGPIVQSANASITAGLPGGLSLNWNPLVHTVFVRSGANTCKGVH